MAPGKKGTGESLADIAKTDVATSPAQNEIGKASVILSGHPDDLGENFLRTLLNTLPDPIWLKDPEGIYLTCNARFESLYGRSESEIAGRTDYDFVSREVADSFREHDREAIAAGKSCVNEEWLTFAADGHRELVETLKTPMYDSNGGLLGVLGIARNITEREKAEQAIRELNEELSATLQAIPDLLFDLDEEGRYHAVWAHDPDLLAAQQSALIGRTVHEMLPEEASAIVMAALREAGETGYSHGQVFRLDLPRGRRWFELSTASKKATDSRSRHFMMLSRDITNRIETEAALHDSHVRLEGLYRLSPMGIALTDMEGHYLEFNDAFREICGYSAEELAGLDYWKLTPREYEKKEAEQLELLRTRGNYGPYEKEYIRKDGRRVPLRLNGALIHGSDGRPYIWSIVEDITDRRLAEEGLRITASVFDNSQEAILITDADNLITDVNPAFTRITGYRKEEVIGRNPKLLSSGRQDSSFYKSMWRELAERGAWRGEIWNRRKSGEIYAELLSISVIRDEQGKVRRNVAIFSDISHIKAYEAELSRAARYDALTGIPNRAMLADRMKQSISQTRREKDMMAVCYLDLDGFKSINDSLGHDAGDIVLVEVARRISETIRGSDTVARLGGDEFVILLLGLEKIEECTLSLERLLDTISMPIAVKGRMVTVGASIGVSVYPLEDEDPDTLLRHADQAMYTAKRSGKHRYNIYDPSLDERAKSYNEFLSSLHHALDSGQFELHYQPKIDLKSKKLVGAEALIRWHHPERGLLFPGDFLHAVQNTALDTGIGEWVIETALSQLWKWRQAGLDIEVSVNLSAHHLESAGFVEMLGRKLSIHPDLPRGKFQIEVLETIELKDVASVCEIMQACRSLGVKFALDDFGTGYSSLFYLSHLPVDVLKIDQSFVRDMLEDKGDLAIVQGIIALARSFGREIVAEGIESREHYRTLVRMGCRVGQGYGIAAPMPAEALPGWKFKKSR